MFLFKSIFVRVFVVFMSINIFNFHSAMAQASTPAQPSVFEALMPFIVLMVVMYFLMIRPQVRKAKEHQKFVTELKRGDEVVTTSGILGRIEGMTDAVVTLEIADGVRVKMLRTQVASSTKSSLEAKK